MILEEKCIKRLVIYFVFDKDGIVDDYIPYMLNALKEQSSEIAVVCNGKLDPEGRQKLEQITPVVIVRENKGLDVWAYKTVLDYYGWDKLCTYDEVIMMNFTIMGPVYPLKEMFDNMNQKDLDFWGITKYHEYKAGDPFGTIDCGYIPEHIQSHFIAVRNHMLKSIEFQSYWNHMGEICDYRDAVGKHEAVFTRNFSNAGFRYDVYADMGEGYNNHPILFATKEMMELKRCPIFKRRSFMQDYTNIITDTVGSAAMEAMEFIQKHTDYDVNMIWDNILRLENQADIKKNMQLNYVLDTKKSDNVDAILQNKKIALVLHFYFEDLAEYCLHYAKSMPKEADIYVTTGSKKKKKLIEDTFSVLPNKVEVILIQNRGRDVSALLVATKKFIMDYDYVCFMHDKKVTQLKPETVGNGFSYKCFENLLPSRDFVNNVIHTFEENSRLGLLTPPPPNHGAYYITLGLEWGLNYQVTKNLADKLGITVPISEKKEPIAPLGTMFWFRPKAMKLLFEQDWEYEDFPPEPNNIDGTFLHAVERIYSFTVQQEGYYPGWVFSDKGAEIEITNLNYMLRGINDEIFLAGPGAGRYEEVVQNLRKTFLEWRMCRSSLGYTEGAYVRAKLYLQIDGTYSEEKSIAYEPEEYDLNHVRNRDNAIRNVEEITVGKVSVEKKETNRNSYVYTELQTYGPISELRWDPGEKAGITIEDIVIKVILLDEQVLIFDKKNIQSNGMQMDDALIFLGPDPQLYVHLSQTGIVKKVQIEVEMSDFITQAKAEAIMEKVQKKSILNRIRNKLFN
ncbi:MAG: rhamnan synthesis F family protein [Lachnospiraceae bacterium]